MVMGLKYLINTNDGLRYSLFPIVKQNTPKGGVNREYSITKLKSILIFVLSTNVYGQLLL